jgi:hypothetical protein
VSYHPRGPHPQHRTFSIALKSAPRTTLSESAPTAAPAALADETTNMTAAILAASSAVFAITMETLPLGY